MHPVLGKIQFKSFDGMCDVHGTQREVAYVSQDGDGPAVLAIRGLTVEDAIQVLAQLEGGLLKGKDAEQPARPEQLSLPGTNGVKKEWARPVPVVVVKPAHAPEPQEEEAEDADVEAEDGAEAALATTDIAAMAKMEKLRPVIELMITKGFKTAKAITEIAAKVKDEIPALREVDKKGNFEARIDRAAMVVLGHE